MKNIIKLGMLAALASVSLKASTVTWTGSASGITPLTSLTVSGITATGWTYSGGTSTRWNSVW